MTGLPFLVERGTGAKSSCIGCWKLAGDHHKANDGPKLTRDADNQKVLSTDLQHVHYPLSPSDPLAHSIIHKTILTMPIPSNNSRTR